MLTHMINLQCHTNLVNKPNPQITPNQITILKNMPFLIFFHKRQNGMLYAMLDPFGNFLSSSFLPISNKINYNQCRSIANQHRD